MNRTSGLTDDESLELFRAALRKACQRGTPWFVMADLIHARLEDSESAQQTAALKTAAQAASGYSVGLINRYVAALARIKYISEQSNMEPTDLLSSVFNGVEAAVKLYDLDHESGLDALLKLQQGKTTFAAVRSKVADAKEHATARGALRGTSMPYGMRLRTIERHRRQTAMAQSLQKGFAPLSGPHTRLEWRKNDRLLACEGLFSVEVSDPKGRYDAIETILAGPDIESNYMDTLMAASLLRATFFRHYYLAFWTHAAYVHANRADRLANWLKSDSIGIVSVEKDGLITIHRQPETQAEPEPDRSEKLEEMIASEYN